MFKVVGLKFMMLHILDKMKTTLKNLNYDYLKIGPSTFEILGPSLIVLFVWSRHGFCQHPIMNLNTYFTMEGETSRFQNPVKRALS